jgi:Co/Zn/Cd efflux system component
LDATLGIVGAILVGRWSFGLIKETGKTLLDAEMDHVVVDEIREVITGLKVNAKITDLHVWKVGKAKFSVILALETSDQNLNADQIRKALSIHNELVHISVEINQTAIFSWVPRETSSP